MGRTRVAGLMAAFLLAGCGGGGSGSDGIVVNPPSPAPSPTPTPTPTPTPSPRPSYVLIDDFRQSRTYSALAVEFAYQNPGSVGGHEITTAVRDDGRASLAYDAASQSFTARFDADTLVFGPSDLQSTTEDGARVYNRNGFMPELVVNVHTDPKTAYVGGARSGSGAGLRFIDRYYVYGDPTRTGDIHGRGVRRYGVTFFSGPYYDEAGQAVRQTGFLEIDTETGAISGLLAPTSPAPINLKFSGTVVDFGGVTEVRVSDLASGYTGTLALRFFGPDGVEIGGVTGLTRPNGDMQAGVLIGILN